MMIHAIILRSLSTETPIAPLLPGGVSASAVMMRLDLPGASYDQEFLVVSVVAFKFFKRLQKMVVPQSDSFFPKRLFQHVFR